MTDPSYTHILAIIDRSGSMERIKSDTEGGFNAYVKDQAAAPGHCRFTVVQFDTEYEVIHDDVPAGDLPEFVLHPRGSTALHDAIGRGCSELGTKLAALSEDQRPGKVIVLILTDGKENASQEFSGHTVRDLVERQRNEYQWEFTFMGANQDAVLTAQTMGIPTAAAVTYGASAEGVSSVFAAASAATTRSRSGGGPLTYTRAERAAAAPSAAPVPPARATTAPPARRSTSPRGAGRKSSWGGDGGGFEGSDYSGGTDSGGGYSSSSSSSSSSDSGGGGGSCD